MPAYQRLHRKLKPLQRLWHCKPTSHVNVLVEAILIWNKLNVRRGTNPAPVSPGVRSETFYLSVGQLREQQLHYRRLQQEHSYPSMSKKKQKKTTTQNCFTLFYLKKPAGAFAP